MNTDMERVLIAERAAELRLRAETGGPAERAEHWQWLAESPVHLAEALAAEACHTVLVHLFRGRCFDADAFVRQAANVYEIEDRRDADRQHDTPAAAPCTRLARLKAALTAPRRSQWKVAAAASFLTLFAVATGVIRDVSDRRISTGPGEWQKKTLTDGTVLLAGPRTKAFVEYTEERRTVRLTEGEAMFHVVKDSDRAFLVETDLATVRAVGTAFAVSHESPARVRVTVEEGVVAVGGRSRSRPAVSQDLEQPITQPIILTASQQIDVTAAGSLAVMHVDLETALAWTRGRLIFKSETVAQAVHEFNRRNRTQIKVLDQAIAQHAVRGVFSATDPESFAEYLERQGAYSIVDEASGTLLLAPHPAGDNRESHGQTGL